MTTSLTDHNLTPIRPIQIRRQFSATLELPRGTSEWPASAHLPCRAKHSNLRKNENNRRFVALLWFSTVKAEETNLTYVKDILPIVMTKCITCHNAGSHLPNWMDYNTVVKKKREI